MPQPRSKTATIILVDADVTLRMREPRAMRRALAETLDALDVTPAEAADAMRQLAVLVREHGTENG